MLLYQQGASFSPTLLAHSKMLFVTAIYHRTVPRFRSKSIEFVDLTGKCLLDDGEVTGVVTGLFSLNQMFWRSLLVLAQVFSHRISRSGCLGMPHSPFFFELQSGNSHKMYITKIFKVVLIWKLLQDLTITMILANGDVLESYLSSMKLSHDLGQWSAPCTIEVCNNQPKVACLAAKSRSSAFIMSHNGSHVISCFLQASGETNVLVDFDFGSFKGHWYYNKGKLGTEKY